MAGTTSEEFFEKVLARLREDVLIGKPTDCDFMTAPLGNKGCHYEIRRVLIIALVLVDPLEVLAHNMAPWWKNWWAERSIASTRKRIDRLEKQLANDEQNEELSPGEEYILKGVEGIGILVILCAEALAVLLLSVVKFLPPNAPDTKPIELLAAADAKPIELLALLIATTGYIGFIFFAKIAHFRGTRSPSNRKVRRKNIEGLKRRLAEKTKMRGPGM